MSDFIITARIPELWTSKLLDLRKNVCGEPDLPYGGLYKNIGLQVTNRYKYVKDGILNYQWNEALETWVLSGSEDKSILFVCNWKMLGQI